MAVIKIASAQTIVDAGRQVVSIGGLEIGVFHVNGSFYAWRNVCPHSGGPVCQGRFFNHVIEVVDEKKFSHGRAYDKDKLNIVCPWHGAEFDVVTGKGVGGSTWSLTPINIFVENGEVMADV